MIMINKVAPISLSRDQLEGINIGIHLTLHFNIYLCDVLTFEGDLFDFQAFL